MKAIIYHSYDDIRLEQRPIPAINEHELLVRVDGCGLCGSDISKIVQQAPPPVILGHELTGTIVQLGQAVVGFAEGQHVVAAHHVPCGMCHYCRHGNYSMCPAFKVSNIDPSGFSEYIRLSPAHVQHTTLPLPETLSAEEGSFTEPLACCVHAVRRTPLLAGDRVVVTGLGSMGLLMVQALKALNPQVQVFGVDLLSERLQLARELGADAVFAAPPEEQGLREALAPYTEWLGADAVILTVPGARPFLQALASIRSGGLLNIFASHATTVPISVDKIWYQELTIISSYSSSPENLRIALDLLVTRAVRVDKLISHHLPLERFAEGVKLARELAALKVYFQIAS